MFPPRKACEGMHSEEKYGRTMLQFVDRSIFHGGQKIIWLTSPRVKVKSQIIKHLYTVCHFQKEWITQNIKQQKFLK